MDNSIGNQLHILQNSLFVNENTLDTIFRPSKNNKLVTDGIVIAKDGVFNGHKAFISKFNKKTYSGKCGSC
ncbi:hypothetical protein, partial [Escherichia coli]|uniref:hypothetical protein n=1 Tax=Escherichia coli TaxID=562 RepID=UPI003D001F3D